MGTVLDFPIKPFNDLPCDVGPTPEDVALPLAVRAYNAELALNAKGLPAHANIINELRRKNEEAHIREIGRIQEWQKRELELLTKIEDLKGLL